MKKIVVAEGVQPGLKSQNMNAAVLQLKFLMIPTPAMNVLILAEKGSIAANLGIQMTMTKGAFNC